MSAKIAEDEITPQGVNGARSVDGTTAGSSGADGTDALTKLQERLEDMRDAIVETETYDALSKRAAAVRRTGANVWRVSKRFAWVLGTSVLILIVPLLYEVDKELGPGFEPNATTAQAVSNANQSSTASSTTSATQGSASSATSGASGSTPTTSGPAKS